MTDPLAGASSGTNPIAWVGLGIALVVLSSFGLADPIRLTLYAVILYVLLVNGSAVAPALTRLATALRVQRPVITTPTGARVVGGSY